MPEQPIAVAEFEERLAAIALGGRGSVFPKRPRDRQILYHCMLRPFDASQPCSEENVNTTLLRWLSEVAPHLEVDHVRLRHYLVDEGYLVRDADGRTYTANPTGRGNVEFEPAVDAIDPLAVIEAARAHAAERRREQAARR